MAALVVTAKNFPQVWAAFRLIQIDSGAHLIGTVYPGDPINLELFEVPDECTHLLTQAEAALDRLLRSSQEEWEEFVMGDYDTAAHIKYRQGDLEEAQQLLNKFFDCWE